MAQTDVRVMVPRVRRAVEGVGVDETLTDDELKDLVADALADITLYTDSVFGKQLVVTATVAEVPEEYATSDALSLAEQSAVAIQAALTHFFHNFVNIKISEKIGDESTDWEYARSAQLLRDQFAYLIKTRDAALEEAQGSINEAYGSFLAVRDAAVAVAIEPWTEDSRQLLSGQEDFRFGSGC